MIIGFVGFGEAAAAIAEGLHEEGAENLICFDAMQNDPRFTEKLEAKRAKAHARRKQTPADLCRSCILRELPEFCWRRCWAWRCRSRKRTCRRCSRRR